MSLNRFMGIGHICADVEVRQVGQSNVGKVTLAMSEKFKKQDGTVGEHTEFLTCDIWGKDAVYPFLKVGVQVYVEGSIRTETWDDPNGQKRYSTKVRVQNIQLLGSRPQAQQQPAQPQAHAGFSQPTYSQPQYQAPAPPRPVQAPQPQMPPQPTVYQQPAPSPGAYEDLPF